MTQLFNFKPDYDSKKPLIIYGFGLNCLWWLRLVIANGIEVSAIFDANPKYHNTTICGIPVLPPEKMGEFNRDMNVLISPNQGNFTLTKMFNDLGFSKLYYSCDVDINWINREIATKERDCEIIATHTEEITIARSLFKEPESLEIFDARLRAYQTGEWDVLEKCYSNGGYYPKSVFNFTSDEVFADCGAFDGGTSFDFRNKMNALYGHIYAFEPNELQFEVTARSFEFFDLKNAEAHRYAICDRVGTISFINDWNGCGSHISAIGSVEVPCTSLDVFFTEEGRKAPTYIKMDIEGAEVDALVGARSIITTNKPKLAICVYHKIEHLWEVPKKIFDFGMTDEYDFYLRHSGSFIDSVFFAAPKSRRT